MLKGQTNSKTETFSSIHLNLQAVKQLDTFINQKDIQKRSWNVQASKFAINTSNPIREIVEHLNIEPNQDKSFIPLSVGKFCSNKVNS